MALGSALLTLSGAEVLLRTMGDGDTKTIVRRSAIPDLAYELVPGSSKRIKNPDGTGVWYMINSHGLRDHELELEKKERRYRILVLGDSVTFGAGVSLEDTFPKRLERKLNAGAAVYEVINAGFPGYNSIQQYVFFKERGLGFHPDLVILAYGINDADPIDDWTWSETIRRQVRVASPPPADQPGVLPLPLVVKHILWDSRLYVLAATGYDLLLRRLHLRTAPLPTVNLADLDDAEVTRRYSEVYSGPSWEARKGFLMSMKNMAWAHGSDFLVVLPPYRYQLARPSVEALTPQAVVVKFCRDNGISILDLYEAFEKNRVPHSSLFLDLAHLSSPGHGIIADEIHKFLLESILPGR